MYPSGSPNGSNEITDAERLWAHIFGDSRGRLSIWTGIRDENGDIPKKTIRERFFNYPDAADTAAKWALEKSAEGREVYFCCHLLNGPSRTKENAAPLRALYMDWDGGNPDYMREIRAAGINPLPTAAVMSSPGHFQPYWRLNSEVPPGIGEDLNKRLTYAVPSADKGGWDLTQLLRVPGTTNHKYDERPSVKLSGIVDDSFSPATLDEALPKIEEPEPEGPTLFCGPSSSDFEDDPSVALDAEAMKVWRGEKPKAKDDGTGEIDRSKSLMKIGRVLYDAGANERVVVEGLKERDIALGYRCYADRRDGGLKEYRRIFKKLEKEGRTIRAEFVTDDDENTGFTQFTQIPGNLSEPLPFPTSAMPKSCGRLITEGAEAIGCPPDFIGLPMLVALGSAIGNSRRVVVKSGWSEGACVYGAAIAAPGEKKTPAQNLAIEPAHKLQIKLRNEYREEAEEHKRKVREWEVKKKKAHKEEEAAPELPTPPTMARVTVGDATVEAVAKILDENPRGVGVFRDELSAWVREMDQYKAGGKGGERQFWLSTWSNETAQFDRKGSPEPVILHRPFAGVFGSIQPDILPELHGNRGDGLLERLLFSYPRPVHSDWTDADISDDAKISYSNLYHKLRDLKMGEDLDGTHTPQFVGFDQDAKQTFIELYNAHQAERRALGFPKSLKAAWPKLEGYLARLCLILSLCRYVTDGSPHKVTAEDVFAASKLLAYFKNHAYHVYAALYGEDPEDVLAYDLARFLAERNGRFRGQPSDLFQVFESGAKPKSAHWLTHDIKKMAVGWKGLVFEDGHEYVEKPETKTGKSTRRFVEITLENCVNCVNLLGVWMRGSRRGDS